MTRARLLLAASALLLASCESILTPRNCATAMLGLSTAEQIAVVLINQGVQADRARKLAEGILIGQVAIASACAMANPPS